MANQEENSNILTNLLSDSIPEEDAFGGHKKVANAIYGLINDEEEGGKAIALSGSFGSGKSTVVDFLKRKFNKEEKDSSKETGIFIFDAWEHQGNPLRRAFLEEYINFLRSENVKWADKNEWEEELEIISKNREEVETTTKPSVTTLGGLFALTILLLPLGLASVRLGLIPEQAEWLLNIGFSLLLLPTILLLGIYVCWRPIRSKHWTILKEEFDLDDFWSKNFHKYIWYFLYYHRPNNHKKSIFNFVVKESTEEIETTSLKSPDPTTIEFQKLFDKITKRVLKDENRQLIIVIDNIDRLTTKSSINAWTTLRAFFESDNKDWEWKDQFWLIAPFDLEELKNLWSGLDHLNDSGKNGESEKTSEYVQAFVDKTFQVLFRVPQPVLSDWKEFFQDQLRIAFPNITEKDQDIFDDITTLYQLKGIKSSESPTPRDIKQFINRVSALYRIWYDRDIKLSTLAFYELVAHKEEETIVRKLKENELVDSTSRFIIDEKDLNRKLAAIHFNCDLEKANHVLYGNEVAKALQNGKGNELKDYYETDGFEDVLRAELVTLVGQKVPLSLSNSALCLKEIEENSSHNFDRLFKRLSITYSRISSIPAAEENLGEGIIAIWERNGFIDGWIKSILRNISGSEIEEGVSSIENWFEALKPIFLKLKEQNKLSLLKDRLKIPGEANDYIEALSFINDFDKQTKEEIAKYLQPNSDSDEIVKAFSESLNSDEIAGDLGTVLYLLYLSEETNVDNWNWTDLVNQIQRVIRVGANASSEQVEAAIKMMLVLCLNIANQNAKQFSNDQNFKDGLFYLIKTQSEKLTGLLVLAISLFNPENNRSNNDNEVRSGQQTYNNILANPEDHDFIENDLFNFLIDFRLLNDFLKIQHGNNRLKNLPSLVIEQAFESEEAINLLSSTDVFEYFDDFYQHVEEEPFLDHLKTLYVREDDLVDKIKTEFETVPSDYKLHYYFTKSCPEELREPYFEFLAEGLRNIGQNEWLSNLKNETELIELVILLQQDEFELDLSVHFKDALVEHYKEVYSGSIDPPTEKLISNWDSLLESLEENIKHTFLKGIKYHIETDGEGMVANIGYLYDSILISEGIYLTETDRFLSTVCTRVLKKNNEVELTWLKELIKQQPEILDQDESATNTFKAEVKHIDLENYSDEAAKVVKEIAEILEVEDENESEDEGS